jgi:serine/threonine protein kinase
MRECPHCGYQADTGSNFCPSCGQRLAASESTPSPMAPALGVTIPGPVAGNNTPSFQMDAPAPLAGTSTAPARSSDLVGCRVGHYDVERLLGEGGEGSVYLARGANGPRRTVAVKVYPLMRWVDEAEDLGVVSAQLELRILNQLDHRHIVKVIDSGVDREAGVSYLVFPYIGGQTLAQRMAAGPMPFPEIGRCITQLSDAVDYLHGRGIIHRDLKPANVLLTAPNDEAVIFDFGIALDRSETAPSPSSDELAAVRDLAITAAGTVMGTAYYMAPEQVRGGHLGPYTDIYALGMIAYQMVTGRVAFEGKSMYQVALQIAQREPPPPSGNRPDIPPPAEFAILKCLSKIPANRYASAGAFAATFLAGLGGEWIDGPSINPTAGEASAPSGPDRLLLNVFFSYARTDSVFVDRLEADLQDNGYRTWVDRHHLVGGRPWKADIERSIELAQVVLVVLSSKAVESRYVRMEYERAIRLQRAIIPILLTSDCSIPDELGHLQVVDFGRGYPDAFKDLLTALRLFGAFYTGHFVWPRPDPPKPVLRRRLLRGIGAVVRIGGKGAGRR